MLKLKKTYQLVIFGLLSMPTLVFAAFDDINDKYGIGNNNPGIGGNGDVQILAVIVKIVEWLLGFVGALAVLMIIVAGIMYLTSGGDEGRVENAKRWLIYAIVGLIVALLGWVIVSTIIGAL